MNDELPQGWALAHLNDLAKVEWGNTSITKKSYTPTGFPAFSASGQDGFLPASEWQGPAVILSAIGARCGKCFLASGKWTAIKNTIVIQGDPTLVDHRMLCFYLNDESRWSISGSGQPFITQATAKSTSIPLPPLEEQGRIADRLQTILGKVDSCQHRLAGFELILKRFRQSVLAAACSGRLTADWRQHNVTDSAQPVGELDGLPENWEITCVGDVIEDLKYGTSQKCGHDRRGVPVLRIPNVANGSIDHSDLKYAELSSSEQKRLYLHPGDILIVRSNGSVSLVGKCALATEKERGFAYAGYLIRIRPNRTLVMPEFLSLALGSYDVRMQIELEARSTSGVNNINSEEVRALNVARPPLEEQAEIVRRVNGLFAFAQGIETRYEAAQRSINRLPQSILTKAFRGELVPTEAEIADREGRAFESAEELLNRIRISKGNVGTLGGNRQAKRRGHAK